MEASESVGLGYVGDEFRERNHETVCRDGGMKIECKAQCFACPQQMLSSSMCTWLSL